MRALETTRVGGWARRATALAMFALALAHVGHVSGQAIAPVMVSKSIPEATVAVIDPESGSSGSSGAGEGTDVRLAPGDVILFRINYFGTTDRVIRGMGAYLTEFIPPNTQVVGIRIIDSQGRTIRPNPPGLAVDGCDGGARCNTFANLPCTTGVNGCVGGVRTISPGSIAQVFADTGVFYSTDARTARRPDDQFVTYENGWRMWQPPDSPNGVANLLGITAPYRMHTQWDMDQLLAFGTTSSVSGGADGNLPFGYGSPVAGPDVHYQFEATDRVADPTLAVWNTADPNDQTGIRFDNLPGPWDRIRYPGSLRGRGTTTFTGVVTRMTQVEDLSDDVDVTPASPLPVATNAIRVALGELRAGERGAIEVALRVLATPIDPLQNRDVDCAEVFGGTPGSDGAAGPWGYAIPSPACVFLNNQFDLVADRTLAVNGSIITYTLSGRNLSTLPQTNVVVTQNYPGSQLGFLSATGSPVSTTCQGRPCLSWTLGTLDPGESYSFTTRFEVTGTGQDSVVSYAGYTSTALPTPNPGALPAEQRPGFPTQAITLVRATPVLEGSVSVPAPGYVPAPLPRDVTLTGTLRNTGTNLATLSQARITMPSGWSIVGAINVGGSTYTGSQSGNVFTYGLSGGGASPGIVAGGSIPVSFTIRVPAVTATNLYDIAAQFVVSTTGYGGSFDAFFDRFATVPVGAARSVPPVLTCPILSNTSTIRGTTTEADGTDVRAYFNLIQRGIDTNATGGTFAVTGTFGPGTTAPNFGPLYGGLEVRATAQAPGELESELSEPCFVTLVPSCSDGLDNDGDGAIDFPADPGCSAPADNDERDVQCSDGIDNDSDGLVDFPDDPECASPDDNSEGGPPACNNGVDDDGDGLVDFPADPGCSSATDRTEITLRACADGIDNDGDGRIDFGTGAANDPGCHSENDTDEANFAYAPGDVRPRILLVFDTSGSMNWHVCADEFTGGDGSAECMGGDVSCAVCNAPGCGNGIADDSRIARARAGVSDVVRAFGDVELGLMRFRQRPTNFICPGTNATAPGGGWAGSGAVCGAYAAGDLLVGFSPENEYSLLEWLDGRDNYTGTAPAGLDIELRGSGTTPLAGSLASAEAYLEGVRVGDERSSCRPYRVILLTDGAETCGGTPESAASSLFSSGFPVNVIGFANSPDASVQLNDIANAGGTDEAIFVDDSTELSAAIAQIVNDAIITEVCNGADDDCDTLVDEGFTLYCDRPNGVSSLSLCGDPGEDVCDGIDDNCDGRIDEGLRNRCGTCGPEPVEVCNGVDDDCDGIRDEDGVCDGCFPSPELCDNLDNDCDTRIDEGLTRVCGTDVGECSPGTETCSAGSWGMCSGQGPTSEVCDGLDNDCDGVIDGQTESCGTDVGVCRTGTRTCVAGMLGACVGAIDGGDELCNTLDDDCDGLTDEGNPGGGAACGTALGICTRGTLQCVGGALLCQGGTGPGTETCNNLDDDCDGRTDEGVPTGAACGQCGAGLMRCIGGTMTCTGDRAPGVEICNGADDDCDDLIDEGNPGGNAACGTETGACEPGTTLCTGGRIVCDGATGPTDELCNSIDDDCDNLVDEGNPEGGSSCGDNDAGECERGTEVCVGGTLTCVGESGPQPERCDGLDNNCDGMIDEGNPGGGDACGDDTGECQAGTTQCVGGTLVCQGAIEPMAEVCNNLDDDCDGVVDDGLSLGAPCGTATGECEPGVLICQGGETVCDGAIGPMDEACNALDDDCDGMTDESLALGGECGDTEGACMPGALQCVRGREICVGEVPRGVETCDCEDDDCDGTVDEEPEGGSLCPGESRCVDCSCALPCVDSEFGRCPSGRVEQIRSDGMCFCVAPRCDEATCAGETVRQAGTVVCGPGMDDVPECACRNNSCTYPCDGVTCSSPTVCNPMTGACVPDDCTGLGCPTGEICDRGTLECVPDPCFDAGCSAEQACRAGTCETSCATVSCDEGERCVSGVCETDLCAGTSCSGLEVCDPATGECAEDMCGGISCPAGEVCDPLTGDCARNACLDLRCPTGQRCVAGECELVEEPRPDGGPPTGDGGVMRTDGGSMGEVDAGTGPVDDGTVRVLAAGGGGCLCTAAGTGDAGTRAPWAMAMLAALGLAIVVRRRVR